MASGISFGDVNPGFQAGIINGNVDATFQLPLKRPEIPPSPSLVIPFARDPDFVERGTTLDQVDQICAAPDAWAALVGLGGVGKSQLAIEHAYRTRERSPQTWVFWVHASNAARFEQSFRDIADRIKIAGRQDPQANIIKLVHDWLCDCKQRWLLVLDNVDDARFLDIPTDGGGQATNATDTAKPLREYLPHCERGSILVTTRSNEAALGLADQCDILNIQPMNVAEGVTLFEKKLGAPEDSSDVAKLAAALEHMPLAIAQAAAYISQRAPRYSVKRYLDEFEKSERKRTSLLNYDKAHLRRDREAKNSIIITWEISFEYIQQTRPSAVDLLSLMSFFDRQGIPEGLLQRRATPDHDQAVQKEGDDTDSDSEDSKSQSDVGNDEFEEDVNILRNFHLVSVDPTGTSFEMHALVQLAMRKWLEANGKLERWKQQFISNLCAEFPLGEYENWTICRPLYAHVKAAVGQRPEDDSSMLEWATVLLNAARFAHLMGNIADAEMLATKAMKARKRILGEEHETLSSILRIASTYKLAGRWLGAEKLLLQLIETIKMKLGADHIGMLISMGDLAATYGELGRWDEAEALNVQVIRTLKTILGADHPYTLVNMGNLATVYQKLGRWNDAEMLEVQVMETRKIKLGADHPYTLISMGNLASIYSELGRWDNAEVLEVQVMETLKTNLGADHLYTLTSMGNLASIYSELGRWDNAEVLGVQVMDTRKTKFGADHPDTLTSMNNLAYTWKAQGRTADAIALMRECLHRRQKVPGASHPHVQKSLRNLEIWEAEEVNAG